MSGDRKGQAQAGKSLLPSRDDFPPGTTFLIKEFDVPLAFVPGQGWFNWFGGTPRPYDPSTLKVGNNWPPQDFEEWVQLVRPGRARIHYRVVGENGSFPMIDFDAAEPEGRPDLLDILGRLPAFAPVGEMLPYGDTAWECSFETGQFRLIRNASDGGWTLVPGGADRSNTVDTILALLRADPNCEAIPLPSRGAPDAGVRQQARKRSALSSKAWIALALSVLLYGISLTQPAYHVVNGNSVLYSGWEVLIIGWFGAFDGMFAWFANPVLFSAWIFLATGRTGKAVVAATTALLLAMSFLLSQQITIDEAGHQGQLRHDGVGYWCWLAAIAVAFCTAMVSHRGAWPASGGRKIGH